MKSSALALLLTSSLLPASPDEYVNFLRQTHFDSFVRLDVEIDPTGARPSPLGVGDLGSLYELWAVHRTSGQEFKIDREFVSVYSPEIKVTVETGDPYKLVARTRVDQPFTARIRISDLMTDSSVPPPAKVLHLSHEGYSLPDQQDNLAELDDLDPQFSSEFVIEQNGELVMHFPMTNLTGTDLTRTRGMEFFTVSSFSLNNNGHGNNADETDGSNPNGGTGGSLGSFDDETFGGGSYLAGTIIERAPLQIWPIAEATISGIEAGVRYNDIPPITVNLVNLYPDSTTYLRVYEGPPSATPTNVIEIGSACVIVRDSVPQNRTILVTNLDEFLPAEGSYTLEVLHDTPFGTDILAQFIPLQVDWSIAFRGSIFSKN